MKINKVLSAVLLVASSLTPLISSASSGEMIETVAEAAITAKIKTLLALEHDIPSLNVGVATKDHVVHLSGEVAMPAQAHRIVEIAQGVKGVKDVDDSHLNIGNTNSYLKDAMITARVKGRILQLFQDGKIAKGYKLTVDTANGEVYVYGKVAKRADIAQIKDMIHSLKHVTDIHIHMQVAKR